MENLTGASPPPRSAEHQRTIETLEAECQARVDELRLTRRIIEDFRSSWSWRVTAPLRWVYDRLPRGGASGAEAARTHEDGDQMAGKILLGLLPGVDARKVRSGLARRAAEREPFLPDAAWRPLVSVVIPHYNAGRDLPYAVDSVRASDLKDWEIVIADDASTDGSRSVLIEQARKDPRIRVLFGSSRQGPAGARNSAIEVARGRYILPLDADNFIEPGFLSQSLAALEGLRDRFVYSHLYRFRLGGRTARAYLPLYDLEELKDANYIDTCALYRRSDWERAGGYKSGIDGYEDWEFWLNLGKLGVTGHRLDVYGFWYQTHRVSMVSHARARHNAFCARIRGWHPELYGRSSIRPQPGAGLSAEIGLQHLRQRLQRKRSELDAAHATIRRFERSLSWRITAPLRAVYDVGLRLGERLGGRINAFEQLLFTQVGPCRVRGVPPVGQLWIWLSYRLRQHHAVRPVPGGWDPLVSVVIPNYNHARYVRDAVLSALRQSVRPVEVIVVDDGSTDGSREVLEKLRRRYHPRLRVILHERNQGLAAARNTGILAARAGLIVPLDADNLLDPDMVRACLSESRRIGHEFIYTDLYRFGKRMVRVEVPEYSFEVLKRRNYIDNCAMFRKMYWEDLGGYKADVPGYEDWEFWLNLGKQGIRGSRLPRPLFYYRVRERSMLTDAIDRHAENVRTIRRLHAEVYA